MALVILVFDYVAIAPEFYGAFFLGKKTIILYWLLQVFLLAATRFTYRYFRYRRTLVHVKATTRLRRSSSVVLRMPKFFSARSKAEQSSNRAWSACCRRRRPISARLYAAFRFWAEWTNSRR